MFDRRLQPMNELYVGVRAFQLTMIDHTKIGHPDGRAGGTEPLQQGESFWFYQLMPFASHKAWLIQQMDEALRMPNDNNIYGQPANPGVDPDKRIVKTTDADGNVLTYYTNAQLRDMAISRISKDGIHHARSTLRAPFDADPYDAIRSADLHNMIGAWRVGRVMDIKAMRYSAYDGGPADTGFATTVDVQVAWQSARPIESLYDEDDATNASNYRNDRLAMYAISQPTGMHGRLGFNENAGYDGPVPDRSLGLDKRDSLRYIPKKRLRRRRHPRGPRCKRPSAARSAARCATRDATRELSAAASSSTCACRRRRAARRG